MIGRNDKIVFVCNFAKYFATPIIEYQILKLNFIITQIFAKTIKINPESRFKNFSV